MKTQDLVILLLVAIFSSCEKNDTDECNTIADGSPIILKKLLVEIKEGNESILEFSFDSLNRMIERVYYYGEKDSIVEKYIYDINGRLDSTITSYKYDFEYENYIYGEDGKIASSIENYLRSDGQTIKEFHYSSCRLRKVTINNSINSMYTVYHYDFRGNTIEIVTYLNNEVFEMTKYRYDNYINPLRYQVADPFLVQNNNVSYRYFSSMVMSSFPSEVWSTYEYDADGYPVREFRIFNQRNDTIIWDYRYNE